MTIPFKPQSEKGNEPCGSGPISILIKQYCKFKKVVVAMLALSNVDNKRGESIKLHDHEDPTAIILYI